ncbi:MAG: hypothetical protein ACXWLT_11985, partial [Rhizomicrobium sp.]
RVSKGLKGLATVSRILGLAALVVFASAPAHAADTVTAVPESGFVRLNFNFAPAAKITAAAQGGVLTLSFDRKVTLTPQAIMALSGGAVASGHADADGKTLRFALTQPIRLHQSALADHAVIDLAPQNFTGEMPDLAAAAKAAAKPVDMASLPEMKLRAGAYTNYTRLVFDWPHAVSYTVFPGAGKIAVRFQALARPDLSALTRFAPPWVKNATWHTDGNATVIEFETDSDSGFHDFKDGSKVVLDILAPKTDAAAYAPPGLDKPKVTAMNGALSAGQAKAIADTAGQLAGQLPSKNNPTDASTKPDAKTADTKPEPKPADSKPSVPAPPAADAPANVQLADSRLTKNGAVVTFKGAAAHPNAVFIRGLTAWVVLENTPNFDAAALKTQLGDFATQVEASSASGISVLRVGLKQAAQIVAENAGADLKVTIGTGAATPPLAISFARSQDDPKRASLTTLLPGSDRVLTLTDPIAGDTLTVIAGNSGHAVLAQRDYAEFAALPTASGLVITPYIDDFSILVGGGRITITRAGGLSLTPLTMPVEETPAAMAAEKNGPSFLDFAAWSPLTGGSFLATERRLTRAVSQLPSAKANRARLTLARFYLANRFAAEALGLINLIQTSDPGLRGDTQLATMRAAADYMMGRYRDAHNDLAGPSFDADRHAALWRGLTEAALENWSASRTYLAQAMPVLKKYQPEWRTRVRLTDAQAALGIGKLELADAAMMRVPHDLDRREALEAELIKARIEAAENHYPAAIPHFAAVENGGDERIAAQAIFYQTSAALAAGAITPKQGIAILERLRYRWRGDALEMKTLRKLAALYFDQRKWQSGLKTLRVATQNFVGEEQAHAAQDDMRTAFTNLYIKGGADKLPPVESLAIFYDNIDLTPIGAAGDDMIRRMVDRLVAMDLLGPAANLLAYQVDKRLDGIAKAQVSTKLAAIYLMDHKPQAAVDALHKSQISGLPDQDGHARLTLEARAFAALKQWDNALDLTAVDDQPDTRRLRADIYWESGNWTMAGQKTEELLGARWSDPIPLSDGERGQVLRMAVAYSLANDEAGLDRLRQHFAPKMQDTPDGGSFKVLSQEIDMHGLAFRDAAAKIASMDTLQSFMKDFEKRHQVVAIN